MEAIDTLAFAKKLKGAGLPDAQAEAFAEAQAGMFRGMLDSTLATKDDLAELRRTTKADLAEFRHATKADLAKLATKEELAKLKTDMWRAMLGQTVALTGIIFAAAAWL